MNRYFFFFFFFNDTATTEIYTRKNRRQRQMCIRDSPSPGPASRPAPAAPRGRAPAVLSLIHISEPTRLLSISYAVFCLKKKTNYELCCNGLARVVRMFPCHCSRRRQWHHNQTQYGPPS